MRKYRVKEEQLFEQYVGKWIRITIDEKTEIAGLCRSMTRDKTKIAVKFFNVWGESYTDIPWVQTSLFDRYLGQQDAWLIQNLRAVRLMSRDEIEVEKLMRSL